MKSKKLAGILIGAGLVVILCIIFNAADTKGFFTTKVDQNVVYTNEDSTEDSTQNYLSNNEEDGYKEKSSEVLNKYFNISPKDDESLHFQATRFDKKSLEDMQSQSKGGAEKGYQSFIERVEKVQHGLVFAEWQNENKDYLVIFNEDINDVDCVITNDMESTVSKSTSAQAFTEDQLKNIAEEFIKENKLEDIKNPKSIFVKDEYVFCTDENDENKKVEIGINMVTGKVKSFAVKAYADIEYEEKSK